VSLVQFKITNHPQQVQKRGASDTIDERITPDWLFDSLNARFGFTLDAAANARNAKCSQFFDLQSDGLHQPWSPHRVWCNPPYSALAGWLAKAWHEHRAGCPVIVMLLPANRTEQRWWQEHVEPFRDGRGPVRTEFIARRFNFGVPGNEGAKFNSSPPFGCVLVVFENSGVFG
jgi:phage N-6-adenine-methyltransferase